jgi:hypothetical protein
MESNIVTQADTAVATMRTLPWLTTSVPARAAARQVAPETALRATSLPVGGYDCAIELVSGADTDRTKTNSIADVWGMDVDHKFSTRLGPTASPPV